MEMREKPASKEDGTMRGTWTGHCHICRETRRHSAHIVALDGSSILYTTCDTCKEVEIRRVVPNGQSTNPKTQIEESALDAGFVTGGRHPRTAVELRAVMDAVHNAPFAA